MKSVNPSGCVVSPMPSDTQYVQNLVSSDISDITPSAPPMASIDSVDDARELHGSGSPDAGSMMHVLADVEDTNTPQTSIAAISLGTSLFILNSPSVEKSASTIFDGFCDSNRLA